MTTAKTLIAAALSSALSLSAFSATFLVATADGAEAQGNGKGNGNGNGNGNGRDKDRSNNGRGSEMRDARGNNGRGAIASELRNLNAMCANGNAMANASPDSNVGQINTFYVAKAEADAIAETLPEEYRDLSETEIAATMVAIVDLIDANNATITALEAELATATDQTTIDTLNGQISTLQAQNATAQSQYDGLDAYSDAISAESEALTVATRGRELSEEALAYFEAGCQR